MARQVLITSEYMERMTGRLASMGPGKFNRRKAELLYLLAAGGKQDAAALWRQVSCPGDFVSYSSVRASLRRLFFLRYIALKPGVPVVRNGRPAGKYVLRGKGLRWLIALQRLRPDWWQEYMVAFARRVAALKQRGPAGRL